MGCVHFFDIDAVDVSNLFVVTVVAMLVIVNTVAIVLMSKGLFPVLSNIVEVSGEALFQPFYGVFFAEVIHIDIESCSSVSLYVS